MKNFIDKDFLLNNKTASLLFHKYAENCPIIDYHCHVSSKEIYENRKFKNITELWLSDDHYKWRLMRANGVDEHYITGKAQEFEKFQKFAEVLPKAIGNPMYHWCHLELKRYFGYDGILNAKTADEVWKLTGEKLKEENMSVRSLIEKSCVEYIGTTDDPVDNLEWHIKLSNDKSFKTVVAPTFRPDKAFDIEKNGWKEYIGKLSEVTKININNISSLKKALLQRMEYFDCVRCKAGDHGLDNMVFRKASQNYNDATMIKALAGGKVSEKQAEAFKTELLMFCTRQYARMGWVMQIHYNCLRNPNSIMLSKLGENTGFDCIGPENSSKNLAKFLNVMYVKGVLPKTILYSLDSNDNAFIDCIIGSFQGTEAAGKLQHGSAWWFNDNIKGMREHLISLANIGLVGNFVGMLTDSRSFLSYTRHEYFRRILCSLIGEWVEDGQYPADMEQLEVLVKDICHNNAARYFNI